jgi:NAD(P)-dependent dehydrogenase (short-subunit alcohol dehydrogenase family)
VVAGSLGGNRQSIDDIDLAEWHQTLNVNTIGPFLIAKHFRQNLAASGDGKLAFITSQLAASTWPAGGRYIYATTKAALNKVGQTLAIDWKAEPVSVAMIHPGWVRTDMGGPDAPLSVEESAGGILSVIKGLTKSDSGKFFKWDGSVHAW